MSGRKSPEQIVKEVTELAEKVAQPLGLNVVDVRLGQQGRRRSVQVTIFRHAPHIGLADCEQVSRKLEQLIDEQADSHGAPLIEGSYVLEVQSPGINRELHSPREFDVFKGECVRVRAKENVGELGSEFTGVLNGFQNGKLTITNARPFAVKPDGKKRKTHHATGAGDNHNPSCAPETHASELELDLKKVIQVKLHSPELPSK